VNGKLIAAGFAEKDPVCTAIVKESAKIVGIGIYNLFAMLNPEAVILGGGLMNLGPEYLKMIQDSFLSHVHDMMYDRLEILNAELGSDSGLIGAAALPLEQGYE
jgi:glucokinase